MIFSIVDCPLTGGIASGTLTMRNSAMVAGSFGDARLKKHES
jgi:hypothetical protein